MKLVDMAKTPEEVKQDMADMPMAVGATKMSGPKYPYGLSISLEDDSLKKLGLDGDMPEVGEIIHFTAIAKVTSASMNEMENTDGGSDQRCRIELQITNMGVASMDDDEDRSKARRQRFYGASMAKDTDSDGE